MSAPILSFIELTCTPANLRPALPGAGAVSGSCCPTGSRKVEAAAWSPGAGGGRVTWQVASAHQAQPAPLADVGGGTSVLGRGVGGRKAAGAEGGSEGTAVPARPAAAPVTRGQHGQGIGAGSRPPLPALWKVPAAALEAPGRWTDSCAVRTEGRCAPEPAVPLRASSPTQRTLAEGRSRADGKGPRLAPPES